MWNAISVGQLLIQRISSKARSNLGEPFSGVPSMIDSLEVQVLFTT